MPPGLRTTEGAARRGTWAVAAVQARGCHVGINRARPVCARRADHAVVGHRCLIVVTL